MKLKFNFDKNAAKDFLLEHVEKFVFAVVALAFVSLVAGAIWTERYERSPDDLQQSAERAAEYMDSIPAVPDRETVPFAQMILDNQPPREDEYRHMVSWNPRLVNPMELRDEPPVLLVRELRGSAGIGAFNMRAPRVGTTETGGRTAAMNAESGTQGQRWAVITGLVPDREQAQAFEEFFRERIKPNPEPDVPEYIYYRVERAEVDPYLSPSDPEQLQWTALNLRAALTRAVEAWSGTAPEVVDERFVHPRLVFPLGPKVVEEQVAGYGFGSGDMEMGMSRMPGTYASEEPRGPWGEEVAHPPQIPLKRQELESDLPEGSVPSETPRERRPDEPDLDLPMRGEGGMEYPGGMDYPRRRPTVRRPGFAPTTDEYAGEGGLMEEEVPEYLLFRFFDYSVEPGKSYRYRVRLMLANPNYGIDPKFLTDPELAEKQWIEKDRWSEPTPIITVPRDVQLLAAEVHPQIRETDEPSGTLAIVKWLAETGKEVHKDFRVTRGQQLDYPETVIRDPRRERRDDAEGETAPAPNSLLGLDGASAEPEQPETVDFVTGMLALDLIGGSRLPGRDRSMTEPGKFLVMDREGTLIVLSEVEDKEEYERRTSKAEPPDAETEMPGMMYEEGMMDDTMLLEGRPPRGNRRGRATPMGSP